MMVFNAGDGLSDYADGDDDDGGGGDDNDVEEVVRGDGDDERDIDDCN